MILENAYCINLDTVDITTLGAKRYVTILGQQRYTPDKNNIHLCILVGYYSLSNKRKFQRKDAMVEQ